MAGLQYIEVNEFMEHLRAHGLVIVKGDELDNVEQAKLERLQKKLMKRAEVTFGDVVRAKLLPLKTRQGVQSWVDSGAIKPGEHGVYKNGRRWVLTSAIKRLGYYD